MLAQVGAAEALDEQPERDEAMQEGLDAQIAKA
jgi:hypothetical protein